MAVELHIESNGFPDGTKVFVGTEELKNVRSIHYKVSVENLALITLEVECATINVEGMLDLVKVVCPFCNEVVNTHSCPGKVE